MIPHFGVVAAALHVSFAESDMLANLAVDRLDISIPLIVLFIMCLDLAEVTLSIGTGEAYSLQTGV